MMRESALRPASDPGGPNSLCQPLDMDAVRVDPRLTLKVPASVAFRKQVLPLCRIHDEILVACSDVEDAATARQLSKIYDHPLRLIAAEPDSLRRALKRVYGSSTTAKQIRPRSDASSAESDDAVTLCDELMQAAALRGASDIHLIPNEKSMVVKLRVDGKLEPLSIVPNEKQAAVISRIKVQSGLDIAEKRSPQDGRFTTRIGSHQNKIDVRVATLPTRFGERVTMRLLGGQAGAITLANLGMNAANLGSFRRAITRPHGLVLLTGPTGSGKSTTLYAAIEEVLRSRGGNVITVEDPIEYEMADVSQVEVDSADKVSFDKALRSILRHDPDVVMIGEIRDLETAEIAVKASLTGHLVFSTLHTNSAVGVVTRLADMGLQRFLIAATLRMAIAQRLVRRLCDKCRLPRELTASDAELLGRPELAGRTVYDAGQCVYCAGRGFTGRVALIEVFDCDAGIAQLIAAAAGEEELAAGAGEGRYAVLIDDAVEKMMAGVTSFQEVLQAVVVW
ncbi:MAG: GspE/PulE family protein [Rubripirellula sp.]|nr:GspE/PulE family protein [Rubripirellula sp.]